MKKAIILILLGLMGMFLSEFLIWNVVNVTSLFSNQQFSSIIKMICFGAIIYTILFSIGIDIIYRFKIKDGISLILLGSIYGLFLEGLFVDLVFRPGFGPDILGISFSRITFPTLSWHAFIDFFLGITIFSLILRGKTTLENEIISLKDFISLICFALFWFIWSGAGHIVRQLPTGVPVIIMIAGLLIPMIFIGILLKLVLSFKDYAPEKVLSIWQYIIYSLFIGYFAISRFLTLKTNSLFISFLIILLFYIILFILHLKFGRQKPAKSIIEESFPIKGNFHLNKYLISCLLIVISFIMFKITVNLLHLKPLIFMLTRILTGLSMLAPVFFIIYVITHLFLFKKDT